jgi:hypothetical protein
MNDNNITMQGMMAGLNSGEGRWWKITVVKGVEKRPIRVALMENLPDGNSFSTEIGFARTNASREEVFLAAKEVLAMVGNYELVVGEFGKTETAAPNKGGWKVFRLNTRDTTAHYFPANKKHSMCGKVSETKGDRDGSTQQETSIDCPDCALASLKKESRR